jgi:tartrate-resistant acid phosphatase type 5
MLRTASPVLVALALGIAVSSAACGSTEGTPADGDPGTATDGTPASGTSGTPGTPGTTPSGEADAGSSGAVPATKAVRFVAMGDTGTGDAGQMTIAAAVAAKCKKDGCDFVQLLGDNLYPSGASSVNDAIWTERFETPYAAIDLDFYAVLGNHDYGANGAGTDFLKGKNEVDYTQKSKKWKMPAPYFHFAKENVELFALDTNMALFSQAAAQKTDVTAWIAASTSAWKIAVGHHPYKSNGPHGNAGKYDGVPLKPVDGSAVKSFLEDTICGKVDVYLCAHDHSQQWLNESCKGTELAVSGAGAKTTDLPGANASLFQTIELGFLYIVIDGKKLTADFVDATGTSKFTHTITKP